MKLVRFAAAASVLALGLTALASSPATAESDGEQQFVVLFAQGTDSATARAAVEAAGGTIVTENTDIGVATVTTTNSDFTAAADAQAAIEGTAGNRVIGAVPDDSSAEAKQKKTDAAEAAIREAAEAQVPRTDRRAAPPAPAADPLAGLQWDMRAIGATAEGSYRYEPGDKDVKVAIIDTGVDGSHPDIAPNFDAADSRNFTVDIPVDANGDSIDGPCEEEPDQSCNDPADVDEDGHGTHVASTIGSPLNGLGVAGVAPNVSLVNLRAGQDSGYFFLQPTVDALTFAGNNGIDVANMSFYVDPWLFNCTSQPEDSPEDQQEQQTIITAVQRALDFARKNGVTLVSAAGNGATDYTKPLVDESSPDFADVPGEVAYTRDLTDPDSCTSMPSEGKGVISVSSTGPSGRKAYYSDYGRGYVDVAAPGGDVYDTAGGTLDYSAGILAAYPESLAVANGEIDETGAPTVPYVVRDCSADGTCAYYQYLQGTSMASPHAAGVAALIVSKYGVRDVLHGGQGRYLPPVATENILLRTAVNTPCPEPREYTYTRTRPNGQVVTSTATCEGNANKNGFYGDGIVNAMRAVGKF